MARGEFTTGAGGQRLTRAGFAFPAAPMSFAAWVRMSSVAGTYETIFEYSLTGNYVGFYVFTATGVLQLFVSGTMNAGTTALLAATWYHVGFTLTGTSGAYTYTPYINGVADAAVPLAGAAPAASDTLTFGVSPLNTNTFQFRGLIAHPTFWNVALTAPQFAAIAATGSPSGSDPRVSQPSAIRALWPFLASTGASGSGPAPDLGPSGYTLTDNATTPGDNTGIEAFSGGGSGRQNLARAGMRRLQRD